ncbi:MAG TPA: DNA gyrase inhibitor YacG [Rhodospirillaceae bacterium]|nr:DNA gyrase inhibitor YacG [Rhodospirillaceae bacterium]
MSERKKCPICQRPTLPAFAPFCSKRCADVDLGNWFGEGYKMPVDDMPSSDDFSEQ